jgi:hypothetical protein
LHLLGGFAGGEQWRRAWTCKLWRGDASTSGSWTRSTPAAANVGNEKTLRV